MPFSIYRDDIRNVSADVVVLPANSALQLDGGAGLVAGSIAGLDRLQKACNEQGFCAVGQAVVTPAFDFPAKYFVHAVGPVWSSYEESGSLLSAAYASALDQAAAVQAQSVVLPLLSAGVNHCPASISLHIALGVVRAFLESNPDVQVDVLLFSDEAATAGKQLFPQLAEHIVEAYEDPRTSRLMRESFRAEPMPFAAPSMPAPNCAQGSMGSPASKKPSRIKEFFENLVSSGPRKEGAAEARYDAEYCEPMAAMPCMDVDFGQSPMPLDQLLDSLDEPFSTTLLALIDNRGLTDAAVYRKANLSRQHFSKIRSNPSYQPTKKTVLALAVALELNLDETRDLLERAGFALSSASKADVIVEWFISRGEYDIFAINEALYSFDQPILG